MVLLTMSQSRGRLRLRHTEVQRQVEAGLAVRWWRLSRRMDDWKLPGWTLDGTANTEGPRSWPARKVDGIKSQTDHKFSCVQDIEVASDLIDKRLRKIQIFWKHEAC